MILEVELQKQKSGIVVVDDQKKDTEENEAEYEEESILKLKIIEEHHPEPGKRKQVASRHKKVAEKPLGKDGKKGQPAQPIKHHYVETLEIHPSPNRSQEHTQIQIGPDTVEEDLDEMESSDQGKPDQTGHLTTYSPKQELGSQKKSFRKSVHSSFSNHSNVDMKSNVEPSIPSPRPELETPFEGAKNTSSPSQQ